MSLLLKGAGGPADGGGGAGPASYEDTVLATSGLISYWRLGEPSGTTVVDEMAANTGTYFGTPTLGVPGLVGDADTAIELAGVSNDVLLKSGVILAGLTNFSIEAWVKVDPVSAYSTIYVERGATGNAMLRLGMYDTGQLWFQYRDNAGTLNNVDTGAFVIDDGVPHQVIVTKAGTAVVLYVDAVSKGTGTLTAGNTLTATSLESRIGVDPADANIWFIGVVDDVSVYNVALAPATVSAHYAAA